ncbi:MAG: hypothetical protein KY438_05370, partial [Actinobacteria bacterium]|nr:hypothetical protein [Actinomycetota bacterium]
MPARPAVRASEHARHPGGRAPAALAVVALLAAWLAPVAAADATTRMVRAVAFSGGRGTVTVDGTLVARRRAVVTLTVTTEPTVRCVTV